MRRKVKEYREQYKTGNARRLIELAIANLTETQVLLRECKDVEVLPLHLQLDSMVDMLQARLIDLTVDDLSIPKDKVGHAFDRFKARQSLKGYLQMLDIEETFKRDTQ